ncbi:uncharacterized protein BKCO1_10000176 [Diplodia corticola]|uniref:Myb-like domain-containing protein n=1 Tax=Diplodia corticola TaxID=236234 RepID=A0A1J9SA30_9PEZI|nr:uncharacterized protein BKCO1_10000176 [Diplodia corticola]OJD36740.1 hypothetical protein BKCO1_10000176 [Diplodia corticola]
MSASDSPMPYVSAAQPDDMDTTAHEWYTLPVNVRLPPPARPQNMQLTTSKAPYDAHYGFVNPYVTPSVSSAGFSPIPEHAKSTGAPTPMLGYTTADSSTFPPVSDSIPFPLADAAPPRLSIPSHLESSQGYNLFRGSDNYYVYGCNLPFDSIPPRPHSSPSVFSPVTPGGGRASEHFAWPTTSNALGISHPGIDETMFNTTTSHHHHPAVLASSPPQASNAPTPEIRAPKPNRPYALIAPHPMGIQRLAATTKRGHEDDSEMAETSIKRRKSSGSTGLHELGEEDKLLLKLKDEETLPWKDIAARFQTDLGKTYQIPALQMRLKRLRERLRVWTDSDVKALRMAYDYWRDQKFEIIASKMMEFGASDRWTAKQCARKWAEIDPSATPFMTTQDEPQQATFSYTASPESTSYLPYMHMP